jgi:2-dehydro-3-deoxyphosphooctonate aldolase (KDO 8-P synthase)
MGPCSLETREVVLAVAAHLSAFFNGFDRDLEWVFKGSWCKDNRTAAGSYTGPGLEAGMEMLAEVRDTFDVRITTDIHSAEQAGPVSEVVDVLQVPAFLCRQTSLLEAAGDTGLPVNVKKGQFMSPANMDGAADKLRRAGCPEVWMTERGTFFGYGDLVVDLRSLSVMSRMADRVVLDVTHSLQRPGSLGHSTGGSREYAPQLARAAAAWGVDGLFLETHPDPETALSDSATMLPLEGACSTVRGALDHWEGRRT